MQARELERYVIHPAELIERKRDGEELSAGAGGADARATRRDEIPDYQLAAFCMAVFFRGLTSAETLAMTEAMVATARRSTSRAALGGKGSTSTRPAASGTRCRSPSPRSSPRAACRSRR